MSHLKTLAIISVIVVALVAIGYLRLTFLPAAIEPNYVFEYMLGYTTPIVAGGAVVFLAFVVILRKPKKVVRRKAAKVSAMINHQIPAYGNS